MKRNIEFFLTTVRSPHFAELSSITNSTALMHVVFAVYRYLAQAISLNREPAGRPSIVHSTRII